MSLKFSKCCYSVLHMWTLVWSSMNVWNMEDSNIWHLVLQTLSTKSINQSPCCIHNAVEKAETPFLPTSKFIQNTFGHMEWLKQFLLAQLSCFPSFILFHKLVTLCISASQQLWIDLASSSGQLQMLPSLVKENRNVPLCRWKIKSKFPIL